jgi:hypothetical protein
MKNLSISSATIIARLANDSHEKYKQEHPGSRVIGSGELKELIMERDSEEQVALREAINELSTPELMDLVALMYVGRGDYVEDLANADSVREAYASHLNSVSQDSRQNLLDILGGKGAAIHRYLAQGLERVRFAFSI